MNINLKIKPIVLFSVVYFAFIWCGWFSQSLLFDIGGNLVMIIQFLLILVIWGAKSSVTSNGVNGEKQLNLLYTLLLFSILYCIVFIIGTPGVAKTIVPIIGVEIPKQVYDCIFNFIFLFGIIQVASKITVNDTSKICYAFKWMMLSVALFNIVAVIQNPELSKAESYSENGSVFTLGYSLSYVLALLVPVFVQQIRQNNGNKVFGFALLVASVISIYYASYFIAIVAILFALLIQGIISIKKRVVKWFVFLLCIFAFLFVTTTSFLEEALLFLASKTNIYMISGRLTEIVDYMNNGMQTAQIGKTTYRFYIYKTTWDYFLKSPVWGNYILGEYACSYDHATLLDMLSCGGIILGGTFLFLLKQGYRFACGLIRTAESRKVLLSCFITYIFLTCINSVLSYRLLGLLFVMIPMLLADGEQREYKKRLKAQRHQDE